MSSTSQQSSSKRVDPLRFKWETRDYKTFRVEISEDGDDLIYHFWPPGDQKEFIPQFGDELQSVFLYTFRKQPKDENGLPQVDVRADYTSYEDSRAKLALGVPIPVKATLASDQPVEALATYYVRVVGWGSNPVSEQLLKDELFARLDSQVQFHAHQEDDLQRSDRPDVERSPSRRRRKRKRQHH